MKISIYIGCWLFLMVAPICGHVNIRLLPMRGSKARIMCMIVTHWYSWFSKPYKKNVEFYGNGVPKASIPYQKCQPEEVDFSFSCSKYERTLTIKNISKYPNMTWHCKHNGEKSRGVFVPALAAPACTVNTTIDHSVPVNNLSSDGSLTLAQGDSLTLNCSSEGGELERGDNPRFRYSWQFYPRETREGEPEGESTESVTHGKFVKHNISRYDAGVFVCTAVYNSTCKGSDTVNVNVLYPPEINLTSTETEEGEVNISCRIIPGNPYNTTVQGWRYVVEGQVIEDHPVIDLEDHPVEVDSDFAIYLSKPSVLDDGEYVCYASNGVTGFHGSVNQTASTSIRSRDRNKFTAEAWKSYLPYAIGGACILLVTVAMVFFICQRKRSKKISDNSDTCRYTNQTFDPSSVQEVFDNETYVSGDDRQEKEIYLSVVNKTKAPEEEVLENENYVSGDVRQVEEICYSVVNKTKAPEEEVLENENYVSGDDRQVEEICYSVVNKTKPLEEEMGNNIYVNTGTAENTQSKIEVLENETYVSGDDRQVEEIVENEFYVSGD